MYGQTNFWLLPTGEYGAYKGLENEIYIMAERSALNLSYQEKTPVRQIAAFFNPICFLVPMILLASMQYV